ncbi:MAG: hypothetical protein A2V98_15795 [Planctomycetes bacterium RBG_16_64_12]|nr:MAG: hypothetical protein A2V98_15795 [Planctomycetes bacterium RBG_16_64_12]
MTGKDGVFTAKVSRGQRCTVRADRAGYESQTSPVTAGSSATTSIVLKARSSPTTQPSTPAQVELQLKVVDSGSNKPLSGVSIQLRRGGRAVAAPVRETSSGAYATSLVPGTYEVSLSKRGYRSKVVNVTVNAQGPTVKTVSLDVALF